MRKILFLSHTPSKNTRQLQLACEQGILHPDIGNIELTCMDYASCSAKDVLKTDGIVLGTTENFGSMAGLTKDFFERIYYPCLEEKQGLPYSLYIRAGQDGEGAKRDLNKILTGLRWKAVQDILILKGEFQETFLSQAEEMGMNFSAGLSVGLF